MTKAGTKLWRLRYRFQGKEQTLSLGQYPDMGLSEARRAMTEAKEVLGKGRKPAAVAKLIRVEEEAAPDFETVAREWHEKNKATWTETHATDVLRTLERDVFPTLDKAKLKDITAPDVLRVLREIEDRPVPETARRVRQRMSAVFV